MLEEGCVKECAAQIHQVVIWRWQTPPSVANVVTRRHDAFVDRECRRRNRTVIGDAKDGKKAAPFARSLAYKHGVIGGQ